MNLVRNRFRGAPPLLPDMPMPSTDAGAVARLLGKCPAAAETPLIRTQGLAPLAALWVKDERGRMGLGSFKALGAAYVIAHDAMAANPAPDAATLAGRTYVTASAGNHGLSVAAGARMFGARAVVYLADTVPGDFATRLAGMGAEVRRQGSDYAASMDAALRAGEDNGWTVLSDTSWPGYTAIPHRLMEGYLQLAAETTRQCTDAPAHIFLQAGVGGLASSAAAWFRAAWGDGPVITVVEPASAPALQASIAAGKPVYAGGPDSIMGRLDCKEPSLIALNGLARDADHFLTLDDDEVASQLGAMAAAGLATTASGGAGLAAAMRADVRAGLSIGADASVLCILSEQP